LGEHDKPYGLVYSIQQGLLGFEAVMPIKILQKQTEETVNMIDLTSAPNFNEPASCIEATFFALRAPYMQWANLARRVIH
jgi:hypothetical protein